MNAPDGECIAQDKTRQPYDFDVKVSIATKQKDSLVVDMHSTPRNLYDGHTLYETLE